MPREAINALRLLTDSSTQETAGFGEMRMRWASSWADIKSHLPEGFNPHHVGFLRDYFRAQLRIQRGQKTKAQRIFDGLEKRPGYREFEDKRREWLAAVDLAVRGKTNQNITPAFVLDKK